MKRLRIRLTLILTTLATSCSFASAQRLIDDVMLNYSYMKITEVEVGGQVAHPTFFRHNFNLQLGRGPAIIGVNYQFATKDKTTAPGTEEHGVMLTMGYDLVLTPHTRLDFFGRWGISNGTNPTQPLYATDTDLRVNCVLFSPDGILLLGQKPFFPSGYAGAIINGYGRVQVLAGFGSWWSGFQFYFTGFHAFNGVQDPANPGAQASRIFANLKNRGVSVSAGYEFRTFLIELRHNFVIENGGNDMVISLTYRKFFRR